MLRQFILLVLFLAPATAALAESVYVNDALYLGLHQDNTLTSTIIELVPSGTELELLGRENNLLQVRTQSGITGWVDGRYITDSTPARAKLAELEAQLLAKSEHLAELEENLRQAEQRAQEANQRADQQAKQVLALKPEPAAAPTAPIPSSTLREMQNLAEENQQLKQQVVELEAMQTMAVERAQAAEQDRKQTPENDVAPIKNRPPAVVASDTFRVTDLNEWQQLLLGSVLLLAFAIGGWLVDLSVRRRHGGYRI